MQLNQDEIDRLSRRVAAKGVNIINGKKRAAASGKNLAVISPIDGSALSTNHISGVEDINQAVDAARQSFETGVWASLAPAQRKQVLLKWADLIEAEVLDLAELDAREDARLTTVRVVELVLETGLPPGVLNVATGSGAMVNAAQLGDSDGFYHQPTVLKRASRDLSVDQDDVFGPVLTARLWGACGSLAMAQTNLCMRWRITRTSKQPGFRSETLGPTTPSHLARDRAKKRRQEWPKQKTFCSSCLTSCAGTT